MDDVDKLITPFDFVPVMFEPPGLRLSLNSVRMTRPGKRVQKPLQRLLDRGKIVNITPVEGSENFYNSHCPCLPQISLRISLFKSGG